MKSQSNSTSDKVDLPKASDYSSYTVIRRRELTDPCFVEGLEFFDTSSLLMSCGGTEHSKLILVNLDEMKSVKKYDLDN